MKLKNVFTVYYVGYISYIVFYGEYIIVGMDDRYTLVAIFQNKVYIFFSISLCSCQNGNRPSRCLQVVDK